MKAMPIFKQECPFLPQLRIELIISRICRCIGSRMIKHTDIHPVPTSILFPLPLAMKTACPYNKTSG